MTKLYIAGEEGFIGSHLQEYVRETTDWEIVSQDDSPDYVVHLAGHSQIDKSIVDSDLVLNDITTTIGLLDWAAEQKQLEAFLYFSSDEVFGPKEVISDFVPSDRYNPISPYAAGKAACESMCMAWRGTYGVPTMITHCQNLFGERQPANKFVPTIVRCALNGEPVPIYVNLHEGKRDFLHVKDACSAIVTLLKGGLVGQKYNISDSVSYSLEYLVRLVSLALDVKIKTVYRDAKDVRPGFFLEHGLDGRKLMQFGWERRPIVESVTETARWMAQEENRHWLGL